MKNLFKRIFRKKSKETAKPQPAQLPMPKPKIVYRPRVVEINGKKGIKLNRDFLLESEYDSISEIRLNPYEEPYLFKIERGGEVNIFSSRTKDFVFKEWYTGVKQIKVPFVVFFTKEEKQKVCLLFEGKDIFAFDLDEAEIIEAGGRIFLSISYEKHFLARFNPAEKSLDVIYIGKDKVSFKDGIFYVKKKDLGEVEIHDERLRQTLRAVQAHEDKLGEETEQHHLVWNNTMW